jgi:hypothetical protein
LLLGKFSLRAAAWMEGMEISCCVSQIEGALLWAWRLANTMGGGGSQIHFALPLPTPNPSSSSPSPLSSGFFFLHSTFFSPTDAQYRVRRENRPSLDETSELQHSLLQSTAPSPAFPRSLSPSLPMAPLASPPLAPRPHMLRSSTE